MKNRHSIIEDVRKEYSDTFDETSKKEAKVTFADLLDEADDLNPQRTNSEPILNPIFQMRELDPYYNYLSAYESGEFLEDLQEDIIDYQVFNKYTEFYAGDGCGDSKPMLWNGIQLDIVDLFVDKIMNTRLKYFYGKNEYSKKVFNSLVLEKIIRNLLKYKRILVVPQRMFVQKEKEMIDGELVEGKANIHLDSVQVYAPHQYNTKKKEFLLKKNGQLVKEKFGKDLEYYELEIEEGLLFRKKELLYMLSMFINNFGVEGNTGVLKLHVDSRYKDRVNADVYEVYDAIFTGSAQEPKPLWEYTQGDIRPEKWATAVDKIIYLINRSIGIDIQGLVYSTATQANLSNVDDIIKINNWLDKIAQILNGLINQLGMVDTYVKFDYYTQDTINEELDRLNKAYQNKGITLEDNIKETYRLLNLGELTQEQLEEKVAKVKIEQDISMNAQEVDMFSKLDVEMANLEGQ